MINRFHKPYPFTCSWKNTVFIALFAGLFVFLFLLFFQPFGINKYENKLILCLSYGLVTIMSILLMNGLTPVLIPRFYNEQKWTVAREFFAILSLLLVISIGNFLLGFNFMPEIRKAPLNGLMFSTFSTFVVGAFPTLAIVLLNQIRLERQNTRKALELNRHKRIELSEKSEISIVTELKQEQLELNPNSIIYAQSQGNYTDLFLMTEEGMKKEVLRITLTALENQLKEKCDFFVRTHRSFIVNAQRIQKVKGNAQGYQLLLESSEEEIPVSRKNIELFNSFYAALN